MHAGNESIMASSAKQEPAGPFRWLDLPSELKDKVLEHVSTLDDLEALSLTSRRVNIFCNEMSAMSLYRIMERSSYTKVYKAKKIGDGPRRRRSKLEEIVMAAFNQPESRPFKVREWLYRRERQCSSGHGENLLEGWPQRLLDGQVSEVVGEQRVLKRHIAARIATQRMEMVDRSGLLVKKELADIIVSDEEDRQRSD